MARFSVTVFLSAFLLFQVQPIMGKQILPWFGGGAAVWNSCMLFFQAVLLGGYCYAHVISTRFASRLQIRIHAFLLAGSCLLLPIALNESLKPDESSDPVAKILFLLLIGVGGPYFMLASTGPLLQRWFHQVRPQQSPWRLYALSNTGSLLALVSYPFLVEPVFGMSVQVSTWSWLYVAFAVLSVVCALKAARSGTVGDDPDPMPGGVARTAAASDDDGTSDGTSSAAAHSSIETTRNDVRLAAARHVRANPSVVDIIMWLIPATTASVMLLATTNQMCIDLASMPLLWIVPLALYLLTFIICFDNPKWYDRRLFGLLLVLSLIAACRLIGGGDYPMHVEIALYSFVLFSVAMTCHGELVASRPEPQFLTLFYLTVAAGGVLGGAFVAVAAPLVFRGFHEYHLALALASLIAVVAWSRQLPREPPNQPSSAEFWIRTAVSIVQWGLVAWFFEPLADDSESLTWLLTSGGIVCWLVFLLIVTGRYGLRFTAFALLSAINAVVLFGWLAVRYPPDSLGEIDPRQCGILVAATLIPELAGLGLARLFVFRRSSVSSSRLAVSPDSASAADIASATPVCGSPVCGSLDCLLRGGLQIVCVGIVIGLYWFDEIDDRQALAAVAAYIGLYLLTADWHRLRTTATELPPTSRLQRALSVLTSRTAWLTAPLGGLCVVLWLFLLDDARSDLIGPIHISRNFYGVLRVAHEVDDIGPYYRLTHGGTDHGLQYTEGWARTEPTTYYSFDSGIGMALQLHPRRRTRASGNDEPTVGEPNAGDAMPVNAKIVSARVVDGSLVDERLADRVLDGRLQIGVVGLGTGTLAVYGKAHDRIRFFEIDPTVVSVTHEYFTYLEDTEAETEVTIGDARISLEREAADATMERFDVLAIDAFSSDAIPLHLLTVECADVYRRCLKSDGLLVVHISNRYLDLNPVARGIANHLGWEAVRIEAEGDDSIGTYSSTWIIITANQDFLDLDDIRTAHIPWNESEPPPLEWTDNFASLWQVVDF